MAIYLKEFGTVAQYNAYTADTENFILPNVSVITENNKVFYNPITPPTPSHDFVEIGGIKWATMNVGANSITDTGLYFQWADIQGYTADQVGIGEGKKHFGWVDYKYSEGGTASDAGTITKYNESDGLTTLQSSDDAVTAAWGGSWRMPTTAEFQTLGTATTSAWTSSYEGSGIAGLILTDKNDSSKVLFFPAAGDCYNGSVDVVGRYGDYWSSSVDSSDVQYAYYLSFYSSSVGWQHNDGRCFGFAVRGVLGE